jgi:hypothetical protein
VPSRADEDLIACFEAGRAPGAGFHHADHVRVAWTYLSRLPLLAAADAFCANLKRFAAAQGKPGLYHDTITLAFLLLIHDRIVRGDPAGTWDAFAEANADLLVWQPSVLARYYSQPLLDSDLARRTFVWPDLAGQ